MASPTITAPVASPKNDWWRRGTVISGPVEEDGLEWYDVDIPGFGTGWVAKAIINAIQVK